MDNTVPIIRPRGPYLSRDHGTIEDTASHNCGTLSLAPPLLITQVIRELQAAPTMPEKERLMAIARAGDIFAHEELEGETPQSYCHRYAQVSGVPLAVAQRSLEAMKLIMQELQVEIEQQQPRGTIRNLEQFHAHQRSFAVWIPRGKTLTVIAPGNHPMTHTSWLQALAFGYHVAVRPGRRDPFTPLRLIRSLLAAGLHPGHLAFLPSTHVGVDRMIEEADLSVVYGNESTLTRYTGREHILVRGPGHSKVFIDQTSSPEDKAVLDLLFEAVVSDGGVRCSNASGLLLETGASNIAEALAERLSRLPILAATDPQACLPVMPREHANNIRALLNARLVDAVDLSLSYTNEPVVDLGDGTAVLRPAVILCQTAENPAFGMELPFPCVWVAPWSKKDGVRPLRNSLVVTMITECEDLVRDALYEQSIRKVHWGYLPSSFSATGIPHDGYIGEFLMEAKGLIRAG